MRGWRGVIRLGAALVAVVVLAACGSSGAGKAVVTHNGIAGEPPAQILAAARAAMRSVSGFVAQGTLTNNGLPARFQIVDDGGSRLRLTIHRSGALEEVLILPGSQYVRANRTYWDKHLTAAEARLLAGRWIRLPASARKSVTANFGLFSPRTFAKCLGHNFGTLSPGGTTTVDGRAAVVVRAAGNVPGGGPSTLAVAATSPNYPLRSIKTGPQSGGGKIGVCGNTGKPSNVRGVITLSHFNDVPALTAPAHALNLGSGEGASE